MLKLIGSLLLLYFLNAFVFISISGEYISPFVIFIIMVVELIIFSIYKKGEIKVKKGSKSKSSTKMTAEKFDMFNDLNDKQ